MKYLDEFSDPELAGKLVDQIKAVTTQRWAIMEVCGGQTHSIIRHGIDQLLPDEIEMIHGPGCPVCVTPLEMIDKALEIASRPDVIFCSFGDMLRVPGSEKDLFRIKSEGGDVRVVYSPLDALTIARDNPDRQVVFFGIGFETTAPANAMTVYQAKRLGVEELLAAGLARAGTAGDRGDHGIADLPGAGVPRRRSRLQRDGHRRVPGAHREVPRSRSWSPDSSRWTSSRASGAPCFNWSPAATSSRTPIPGRRGGGQPGGQGDARGRLRGHRPGVARHRHDPAERLAAVAGLPGIRRRAPVLRHRHPHRRVGDLPVRRGAAGH